MQGLMVVMLTASLVSSCKVKVVEEEGEEKGEEKDIDIETKM